MLYVCRVSKRRDYGLHETSETRVEQRSTPFPEDNVRFMAQQLFEYVLNNHQVVTEPVGILHAFNIALCWRAASLLNCKVDRRESLALAEKRLNCECNEDLVALMYRKLRTLKEKFPYREGETSIKGQPV